MQVYLDMDGVICDFVHPFTQLSKETGLPITYSIEGKNHNKDQRLFEVAVKEYGIFQQLPPMPDMSMLKQGLDDLVKQKKINVEILTSVNSYDDKIARLAIKQKQKWLDDHGFEYKANFVNEGAMKGAYAKPNSLLIDDSEVPCYSFGNAGGSFIRHTAAVHTLHELVHGYLSEPEIKDDKIQLIEPTQRETLVYSAITPKMR